MNTDIEFRKPSFLNQKFGGGVCWRSEMKELALTDVPSCRKMLSGSPVHPSQTWTLGSHSSLDSASPFLSCFSTSALCRFMGLVISRSLVALPLMLSWLVFLSNNLKEGQDDGMAAPGDQVREANEATKVSHHTRAVPGWALYQHNCVPHPSLLGYWNLYLQLSPSPIILFGLSLSLALATDIWYLPKPISVPLTGIPVASSAVWPQFSLRDVSDTQLRLQSLTEYALRPGFRVSDKPNHARV